MSQILPPPWPSFFPTCQMIILNHFKIQPQEVPWDLFIFNNTKVKWMGAINQGEGILHNILYLHTPFVLSCLLLLGDVIVFHKISFYKSQAISSSCLVVLFSFIYAVFMKNIRIINFGILQIVIVGKFCFLHYFGSTWSFSSKGTH